VDAHFAVDNSREANLAILVSMPHIDTKWRSKIRTIAHKKSSTLGTKKEVDTLAHDLSLLLQRMHSLTPLR
jgi:hypothetical protein